MIAQIDKPVCKECGKPMSATGDETINNQLAAKHC
jgi:tRNA(Ile2) C34 agmatinyltransferase TiaS